MKLQKKKIEPLQSTEPQTAVLPSTQPGNLTITLHRSCKTCPLSAFIEAYANQNYELLGTGTPEEISEAWNEILFDWATLIKTENSEYIFELTKRMDALEAQIIFIEKSIAYLQISWDEEMAGMVRECGFNPDNPEMTLSLAKRLVFDLNEMRDEYDRLTNTVKGKKKTEDEFYEDIAMLSKFQGYNIDPDTTTVKKYASVFNLYLKQHNTTQAA